MGFYLLQTFCFFSKVTATTEHLFNPNIVLAASVALASVCFVLLSKRSNFIIKQAKENIQRFIATRQEEGHNPSRSLPVQDPLDHFFFVLFSFFLQDSASLSRLPFNLV